MSRASLFALRRREFARHAAAGRPYVALARAPLWLLLARYFLSEGMVCAVFFCVYWLYEVCADLLLSKYITCVFRRVIVMHFCDFCGRKSGSSEVVAFLYFLMRLCMAGPLLQLKGGEH